LAFHRCPLGGRIIAITLLAEDQIHEAILVAPENDDLLRESTTSGTKATTL
jgi:hypothetical protein